MTSPTKHLKPKIFISLKIRLVESFEGLNRSLEQLTGSIWSRKWCKNSGSVRDFEVPYFADHKVQ